MHDPKTIARSRSAGAARKLNRARKQVNTELLASVPKSKRSRIARALRGAS